MKCKFKLGVLCYPNVKNSLSTFTVIWEFLNSKFKMLQVQQGPLKRWLLHSTRENTSLVYIISLGQVIRVFPFTLNKITYINACLPQMFFKAPSVPPSADLGGLSSVQSRFGYRERERRYQWNSRKIKTFLFWLKSWTGSKVAFLLSSTKPFHTVFSASL